MFKRIDHIGIAVAGLKEALEGWRDGLGLEVLHIEEVPEQQVRAAFLPVDDTNIELLEPTGPESPIAKYLAKRGGGIHHICVEVEDIEAALARMKSAGMQLIDETPRRGAHNKLVAFVHPKSTGGVLIELSQPDTA